jgi:hypothetical protein
MKSYLLMLVCLTEIFLLSCKKKEETQQPQPKNKNLGFWVGFFDGEKNKTTIEITENRMIIGSLIFEVTELDNYVVKTGLNFDNKKYITYYESSHFVNKDTLFINFVLKDKGFKQGKFVK